MHATRRRRVLLVTALGGVAVSAACTLNPQPLPPSDAEFAPAYDSGAYFVDARAPVPNVLEDAGTTNADGRYDGAVPPTSGAAGDASSDASDGGDAGASADGG